MTEQREILICYDGSDDAERAVDAAAVLLGSRHAVVLNVAPPMTFAEGMAATSSLVPGSAFEDLNRADALIRAKAGAARARRAGLDAEARATTRLVRHGRGSSTSPTSSTRGDRDRVARARGLREFAAAASRTTWPRMRGDPC